MTFNTLGRHVSRMVYTRITSVKSPWFAEVKAGDVVTVPVSHGEGRFVADDATLAQLIENGQIATQYVDPFLSARNVPGEKDPRIFESGVAYFK